MAMGKESNMIGLFIRKTNLPALFFDSSRVGSWVALSSF